MPKSAASEISEWADQCRRWARAANGREQKLMLQSLERLLNEAAFEADDNLDNECDPRAFPAAKFLKKTAR
jgi:hypothetical protein